ncbi:MAG: hypothetical protein ABIS50_04745 [Luteolibacter sp.]|uniref:hypothetical protein n=1 Tax=Luteolibacter sp. TaxID=1962973 RepID=UPI003262EC80
MFSMLGESGDPAIKPSHSIFCFNELRIKSAGDSSDWIRDLGWLGGFRRIRILARQSQQRDAGDGAGMTAGGHNPVKQYACDADSFLKIINLF